MTDPTPKSPRDHAIEATIRRVEAAIADWHRGAATREQVSERIREAVGELPE